MKWYFPRLLPGQVETEVTQRDQFHNDDFELSETLVREAIQNSLDAAITDDSAVRVAFRWVDLSSDVDGGDFNRLFEGQIRHAEAAGYELDQIDFDKPCALIIEDFGTKGLTGNTREKDDDNFSDFWRRHGKSHKTGSSRGRWGLGKLVYSTSSRLGVFFGVTRRASDNGLHLMGQTVLTLRTVDGYEYPPHGYFADVENENDPYHEIPVPIKNESFVTRFVRQFTPERVEQNGLSVIIPYPKSSFSADKMIGVAIINYFYPIITGQLTVQCGATEINTQNIRQLAHEYARDHLDQIDLLFDFIESAHQMELTELLHLKDSWIADSRLADDDFDEADLQKLRERFAAGKMVGLWLPVKIKKKRGEIQESGFSVFIQKPEGITKGEDLYVRGGLTVPGETKFRERKALGAMIAKDEPVCALLGDAENAAHTKWIMSAEKVKKNYQNPQKLLRAIKNSVVELYDLLEEVTDEYEEDALRDFLWANEPDVAKKRRVPSKTPGTPVDIPKPRKPFFRIAEVAGGFTVTSTENANPEALPKTLKIQAAYDVSRGNPFKKYSEHDFKFGSRSSIKIVINKNSAKLIDSAANELTLEVTALPFKMAATGFDNNRDLKVRVV